MEVGYINAHGGQVKAQRRGGGDGLHLGLVQFDLVDSHDVADEELGICIMVSL